MNRNDNEMSAVETDNKYQRGIDLLAATTVKVYLNAGNGFQEYNALQGLEKVLVNCFTSNTRYTMVMKSFAGGGKSRLLESLVVYAQRFLESIECTCSSHEVKVIAVTSAAASEITGKTIHRLLQIVGNGNVSNDDVDTVYPAID